MGKPDRDPQQRFWTAAYRLSGCMMVFYGLLGLILLAAIGLVAYALFGIAGALATAVLGLVLVALIRWASG